MSTNINTYGWMDLSTSDRPIYTLMLRQATKDKVRRNANVLTTACADQSLGRQDRALWENVDDHAEGEGS